MAQDSLKFCIISTFYPPYNFGGDGMHLYRLVNELGKLGHKVDVFHCQDAYLLLAGKTPEDGFPNHRNVTVTGLRSPAGVLSPLMTQQTGIPFLKNGLKKALESNKYDVVHYNNMSLIGITALGYGNAPVKLYTTHEHWLVCPMHVLWKFDREVCTKKECVRCQIKGRRPPQLWRYSGLLERMLGHIDCFLSPSRFTLRKHKELGLDIPMTYMPYFLPCTEDEKDERIYKNGGRKYFLFVGRLEYIKGVQNLISVFRRSDKFDLIIAGDGEYRSELEKQAEGHANIKFLGSVGQDRLKALYQSARAVIVPSICYETFGIIIIEAFSRKTPVIVNDLGALPEVIEDSGGGFVYESEDALTSYIEMLAEDTELRDDLGRKGYKAYRTYWDEKAHIRKYLGLVDEIRSRKAAAI